MEHERHDHGQADEASATGFFAKVLGINTVSVHAKATAVAAIPAQTLGIAPITVNILHPQLSGPGCPCFNVPTTLPLGKTGAPGAFALLNLDNDDTNGTVGASTLASWISKGYDSYLPLGVYFSDPGAKWNNSIIQNALIGRYGTDLLFPVYDTLVGSGSNAEYHVIAWVGFHLQTRRRERHERLARPATSRESSGRESSASPAPPTPPSPTSASARSPSSTDTKESADMTYRLRNIAVAVGLALVAALLTTFYVANYKRHVRQSESTVKVFVAKRDIPAGHARRRADQAAPDRHLRRRRSAPSCPGAISSPDQVRDPAHDADDLRRRAGHAPPLRDRTPQQGIRSQLHGTLRAISLPGTTDQLLAGTLKDGDHVDVIANLKTGGCSDAASQSASSHANLLVLHAPAAPARTSKVGAPATVRDARRQRPPRGAEDLVRGRERRRLDAPAAPGRERDRQRRTTSKSDHSMLEDGVSPANAQHYAGSRKMSEQQTTHAAHAHLLHR